MVNNRQEGIGKKESSRRNRQEGIDKNFTNYQLPITHYPLPITHYQLPITHYQLPITNTVILPQEYLLVKLFERVDDFLLDPKLVTVNLQLPLQ